MRAFLCGGGSGVKTQDAYNKLNEIIDKSKPVLYIPLAMNYDEYDSCFEWITAELKGFNICKIDMVRSAKELYEKNLDEYCAIFIGGGNTFKLLFELKLSGCFEKIKNYILNDGIVFGGSAGAIIMGYDISSCECDDENNVGLVDTKGLNLLNGYSLICHYGNRDKVKQESNTKFLLDMSKNMPVVALPEDDTIFINNDMIEVIGSKSYYVFSQGICKADKLIETNI